MSDWPKKMGTAFMDHSETVAEVIPADLGQEQNEALHDALGWIPESEDAASDYGFTDETWNEAKASADKIRSAIARYEKEVGLS